MTPAIPEAHDGARVISHTLYVIREYMARSSLNLQVPRACCPK